MTTSDTPAGFNLDDLHPDAQDELCFARICYNANRDKGLWYAALRVHCGYTGGSNTRMQQVGQAVDAWLVQHPSWRGRYK